MDTVPQRYVLKIINGPSLLKLLVSLTDEGRMTNRADVEFDLQGPKKPIRGLPCTIMHLGRGPKDSDEYIWKFVAWTSGITFAFEFTGRVTGFYNTKTRKGELRWCEQVEP